MVPSTSSGAAHPTVDHQSFRQVSRPMAAVEPKARARVSLLMTLPECQIKVHLSRESQCPLHGFIAQGDGFSPGRWSGVQSFLNKTGEAQPLLFRDVYNFSHGGRTSVVPKMVLGGIIWDSSLPDIEPGLKPLWPPLGQGNACFLPSNHVVLNPGTNSGIHTTTG